MAFNVSSTQTLVLLLYALLLGALFGVIYDIFRISRVMLTGVGIGKSRTSFEKIDLITKRIRGNSGVKNNTVRRIKNRMTDVIIFAQDLLFFVICALVFTVFLYQANFGQPRLFIYLGAVAGFILYYNTFGRVSAALSGIAVSCIRLALTFLVYKVAKPQIKAFARAISVPVEAYKLRSIIATGERERARLFMMSETGFGISKKAKVKNLKRRGGHEAGNEKDQRSG